MSRTTTILAMALSTLLVTSAAVAGPKKMPPTATDALPVNLARMCPMLGEYAATVAVSRDAGATLSGSLSLIRQEKATHGMESNLQAILQEIVYQVYRSPSVTPRQLAQVVERACVETGLFQDARLRY